MPKKKLNSVGILDADVLCRGLLFATASQNKIDKFCFAVVPLSYYAWVISHTSKLLLLRSKARLSRHTVKVNTIKYASNISWRVWRVKWYCFYCRLVVLKKVFKWHFWRLKCTATTCAIAKAFNIITGCLISAILYFFTLSSSYLLKFVFSEPVTV